MQYWYVARTRPLKERVAQLNLNNQGIVTFLPRIWRSLRCKGIFKEKLHPLFPGYIFFKSAQDPALWRAVGGTQGVSYVLWGGGRRPRPVPQPFMSDLLSSCVDEVLKIEMATMAIGTSVQIKRGPLSGRVGNIVSLDGPSRVALLLDLLGGVRAQVELANIERAN